MSTNDEEIMTPRTIVLQSRLLLSSSEQVREWLEQRATKPLLPDIELQYDEAVERSLLAREDPLIDLSLAQFAAFASTIKPLFTKEGPQAKVLRVAILMNELIGKSDFLTGLPSALIKERPSSSEDGATAEFLSALNYEEITALFSNPTIEQDFLRSFLDQKAPWQGFTEKGRLWALSALSKNPRMDQEHSGYMDGWAESSHNAIFNATWLLSQSVPVTPLWANVMGSLYRNTKASAFSIEDPLALLPRWVSDPADEKSVKRELATDGYLGPYGRVRQQLARLAVANLYKDTAREALASHEDIAVRAAYYAYAVLSTEEIEAAYEKDGMLAFNEIMSNKSAWRTVAQRQLLHDIAWDDKLDPNAHLIPPNMYKYGLSRMREMHPEWFKDEDKDGEQSVTHDRPTDTGDPHGPAVPHGAGLAQVTHAAVQTLLARTAWFGWGLAAILAVLLLKSR